MRKKQMEIILMHNKEIEKYLRDKKNTNIGGDSNNRLYGTSKQINIILKIPCLEKYV